MEGVTHLNIIKTMNPPIKIVMDKPIMPCSYLIEEEAENFYIHRQLQKSEVPIYDREDIFEYNGGIFLRKITKLPTEERALKTITFFWDAIDQLNTMKQTKVID